MSGHCFGETNHQAGDWTPWLKDFNSPPLPPLRLFESSHNDATEDFFWLSSLVRFLRADLCLHNDGPCKWK